jgi:hypothetical protein
VASTSSANRQEILRENESEREREREREKERSAEREKPTSSIIRILIIGGAAAVFFS